MTRSPGSSTPATTMDVYEEIKHLTMRLKAEVEFAKLKSRLAFHQSAFGRSNVDTAAGADSADSDSDWEGSARGSSVRHLYLDVLSRTSTAASSSACSEEGVDDAQWI